MWMQHYLGCEEILIHGLRAFNQSNINNDMMDIDGCRNVVVSDCIGDTEDDGITLFNNDFTFLTGVIRYLF